MIRKYGIWGLFFLTSNVLMSPVYSAVKINSDIIYKESTNGVTIEVAGPGPNLQDMVDDITDAASNKPYLVKLGAGFYALPGSLEMKPYVSIDGSGENSTILSASVSAGGGFSDAVVEMALNSTLSNLTVINSNAMGTHNIAVLADDLDLFGDSSTAQLRHVTVISGGSPSSTSRGVHMETSSIRMSHVTVEVDGNASNYGVRAYDSSPLVHHVLSVVSGGTANRAFYSSALTVDTTPTFIATTGRATGTSSYGHYISEGASNVKAMILRSSMHGGTNAVSATTSSEVIITQSLLEGGITDSGTYSCVANSDGDGQALDKHCE